MSAEQEQDKDAPPAEPKNESKAVYTHAPPHFSADQTAWGEDISPDKSGILFKKVLREGEGENTPLNGDKVYVHYEGRLMDQTQFDSSKGGDVPFEVNIGLSQVIKGWDIGIVTMKKGELCLLTCLPEMAYGGEEFQDSIPPNSTLQFEVELISWHGMYCTKDPGGPEVNVLKSFVKEGDKSGSKVKDSAEVTVNIIGKHQDKVFFKEENFSFSIDECGSFKLPPGIEHGIKKMKKGEIGRLYIPPCYGFGDAGCEEFQIPPGANLVYEIDLLSFNNLKESWEYDTIADRVEAAKKLKLRGTDLLKDDHIPMALKTYEKGHDIVKLENLEEEEKAATKEIRLALQLNISLCQLKLHAFSSQYRTCTEILKEDPANLKALFRRGMAGIEIREYLDAISDFDKVLELEPDNKGALKLKEQAKLLRKGENEKEKRLYTNVFSKMFAETDPAAPKDTDAPTPVSAPPPDPAPDPVSAPTPDSAPDPVSAPTPDSAPDPVSAPTPDSAPDPVSAPAPDPAPAPVSAPAPGPVSGPAPGPVPAPVSAPVPGPVSAPAPDPAPAPVPESEVVENGTSNKTTA